jgi:hypothetical protein
MVASIVTMISVTHNQYLVGASRESAEDIGKIGVLIQQQAPAFPSSLPIAVCVGVFLCAEEGRTT